MRPAAARFFLIAATSVTAGCLLFPAHAITPVPLTAAERAAVGCYEIAAPRLFRRARDPRLRIELDSEQITQRVLVGHTPYTWRSAWMDGFGYGRYRLKGDTIVLTFGTPDQYGLTVLVPRMADSTGVASIYSWIAFNPAFDRYVPVAARRASCAELWGA